MDQKTQFNKACAAFAASLSSHSREEIELMVCSYFEQIYQIRNAINNGEKYLLSELPTVVAELQKDKERLDFIVNNYSFTLDHGERDSPRMITTKCNFKKSKASFIRLIDHAMNRRSNGG